MWMRPESSACPSPSRPRERRQRRERQVDLSDHAGAAVVADPVQEVGVELDRLDERQERALRVGVRDDGARRRSARPWRARRRVRAPSRTSTRATSTPVRISAPRLRAAAAERLRQRADSARDEGGGPGRVRVDRRLEEQVRPGAGRPGAGEHPVDAARRDRRAQQLRLEPLGDEIRDGHRAPAQQPVRVPLGQARGSPCRA